MKTPVSFIFFAGVLTVLSACSNLPFQHGSEVEERTRPPKQLPKSANIPFATNPMLGATSAKIGVVEFSDYQCPYCRTFHTAVLPELKKNHIDTGKVIFVPRDAPMDFHPMAEPAAIAANCADEQGAYYPMQEDLYAQQNRFGNEFYLELAGKLGLDIKCFETCLHNPAQQQEVRRDAAFAGELGVERLLSEQITLRPMMSP